MKEIEFETLIICPGGILKESDWDKEQEKWVLTDITDELPMSLYDKCILDENLTLKDIILLCKKHEDLFKIIQRKNFFNDYIDYLLEEDCEEEEFDDTLEVRGCEINFTLDLDLVANKDTSTYSYYHFDFYGIDTKEPDMEIGIGVIGHNVRKYVNLPIRLKEHMYLTDSSKDIKFETNKEYRAPEITLGEIINTIFYEISFYGGPAKAKDFFNELRDRANECKKEYSSLEEALEDIGNY